MADKPAHWPADVEPLVIEEFDKLGRNSKNELFWDGRRLITRSQFLLTWPQTMLAILAAIASLATIATGLNNASIFLCGRGITLLGCPARPSSASPAASLRSYQLPASIAPPAPASAAKP
jgi:hypothetical protein